MSYSGGFKDIVYADEDRAPRALKYRIVFVDDGSLAQLSLFAVPALSMSLIFKDIDLKGLHYRA
jgi:hypothetical protein